MDIARNTTDNGPAPAFFVVGTVATAGNGVATGVIITRSCRGSLRSIGIVVD